MIRIVLTAFAAFAISVGLVAAAILPNAIASPSTVASSALAFPSARSFHGYYLATFTDEVGSTLPFSSLCLRFKPSGTWANLPNGNWFNGTYLISGNELFASAIAPWSPVLYASFQGSVNATQGSGDYIVMQSNGDIYSGGTFTLTRNSSCS